MAENGRRLNASTPVLDGSSSVDVALLMPNFGGGGAERMMARLARALSERGRRIEMVVCTADGPFTQHCGPDVSVVELGRRSVLASLPALVRYLRRTRPKVLMVTLDHMSVMAIFARWIAGVDMRLVIRQANNPLAYRGGTVRDRLVVHLLRSLLKHADAIATGSQGVACDLIRWARLPSVKVHVVGNPVVDDSLAGLAQEDVNHPFFAPGAPPVILGAGRLTPQKDFHTLLRAFVVARRMRPLRLIILGEGPDRTSLEAFVEDQGLAADVRLPGFVENPFAYMRRSQVFVLSSAWEGLPGVLVQAMACGCPVVSTDCRSGPSEILAGGRFGPLVPVGDADALGAAIVATVSTPIEAAELREAISAYSVERSVTRYEAVLWP